MDKLRCTWKRGAQVLYQLCKRLEAWYLVHFKLASIKPRVIADCSAEYLGHSLNKKLLSGPDLLTPLINVLLGWREFKYAVMADIKAMFHCVMVLPEFRRFQRFLWFPNSDYNQEPVDLEFNVVVFGSICGPFLANDVVQQCGRDNIIKVCSAIIALLKKAMYMDDFLKSFAKLDQAASAYAGLGDLLATASMHLTKVFAHPDVLKSIKPDDIGSGVCDISPGGDISSVGGSESTITKALGIIWNFVIDNLTFRVRVDTVKSITRRSMLKQTAKMFDPMGLACIFTLPAKIMIQTLFARKLGWDVDVPSDIKKLWTSWIQNIKKLEMIQIPRCLIPNTDYDELALHVFL